MELFGEIVNGFHYFLAVKVRLSPSKKKIVLFNSMKAFENDEKCFFLFSPKSTFRSQDIQFFVSTIWSSSERFD